jgi:type I restriction enzyme M protein
VNVYLEAHTRRLQQAVELLYDKYSVTLTSLIEERKAATDELENYLIELGYIEKMNN